MVQKAEPDAEKNLLEMVLMGNESLLTYRYRYRSTLELSAVLELLLIEENNPRSIVYQIEQINKHLQHLPIDKYSTMLSPAEKKLLEALTLVRLCDIHTLVEVHEESLARENLHQFLHQIMDLLTKASNLINAQFFSLTQKNYGFVKSQISPDF